MPPYILAVDLGGTQIRAALCDPQGQIYRRVARLTLPHEGVDPVIGRIVEAIADAMGGTPADQVAGIGIGAPGPVDPVTGTVVEGPNLGWHDVPLRPVISEHTGRPTYLGNDANLAGLAEYTFGAARGVRDVIYLTISTGIGSGIIIDGRMLLGAKGLAAEAGHTVVLPDGPLCGCGNRGCLEALASGTGIAHAAAARLAQGEASAIREMVGGDLSRVDARVVGEAAKAGDPLAVDAFGQAGRYLGIGIANLLYLFNPRMIVLGGSVTKAGPLLTEPMWEAIRAHAKPHYVEGLAIVRAALGDDVGLLGAAALAARGLKLLK